MKEAPTEAALLLRGHSAVRYIGGNGLACRVEAAHEAFSGPKLNAEAINQLPCPDNSVLIIGAYKCSGTGEAPVFVNDVDAVHVHLGDAAR
jgi:hypothetical protein